MMQIWHSNTTVLLVTLICIRSISGSRRGILKPPSSLTRSARRYVIVYNPVGRPHENALRISDPCPGRIFLRSYLGACTLSQSLFSPTFIQHCLSPLRPARKSPVALAQFFLPPWGGIQEHYIHRKYIRIYTQVALNALPLPYPLPSPNEAIGAHK